jgi:sterol 24-C-methyltransferase
LVSNITLLTPKMSSTASGLERENHQRDAAFNKALHGNSATATGGFSAMLRKNHAAKKEAVDEYFKHWDNKQAQDETSDDRAVSFWPLKDS